MDLEAAFLTSLPAEKQRFVWVAKDCQPNGYMVHFGQYKSLCQKKFTDSSSTVNEQSIQLVSDFKL